MSEKEVDKSSADKPKGIFVTLRRGKNAPPEMGGSWHSPGFPESTSSKDFAYTDTDGSIVVVTKEGKRVRLRMPP